MGLIKFIQRNFEQLKNARKIRYSYQRNIDSRLNEIDEIDNRRKLPISNPQSLGKIHADAQKRRLEQEIKNLEDERDKEIETNYQSNDAPPSYPSPGSRHEAVVQETQKLTDENRRIHRQLQAMELMKQREEEDFREYRRRGQEEKADESRKKIRQLEVALTKVIKNEELNDEFSEIKNEIEHIEKLQNAAIESRRLHEREAKKEAKEEEKERARWESEERKKKVVGFGWGGGFLHDRLEGLRKTAKYAGFENASAKLERARDWMVQTDDPFLVKLGGWLGWGGEKGYRGTKYAGKKAYEGAKYAGDKAYRGAKYAGGKIYDAGKYAADSAYAGTKYVAGTAWDGTKGFFLFIFGTMIPFIFMAFQGFFTTIVSNPAIANLAGIYFNPTGLVRIYLSIAFLLYTTFMVFKGNGLYITIIFLIWYIGLSAMLPPPVMFIVAAVFFGIIYFLLRGESAYKNEWIGLLGITVFLCDLGGIAYVAQLLGISGYGFVSTMALYMPWWGFLGVMITNDEGWFTQLSKMVMLLYLFAIIVMPAVSPYIGQTGTSDLPTVTELLEQQQKLDAEKSINPIWYTVAQVECSFKATQGSTDANSIKKCQDEYIAKKKCEAIEGDEEKAKCIETEIQKASGISIAGGLNSDIKDYTKASINIPESFTKQVQLNIAPQQGYTFPFDVVVDSPEKEIAINTKCSFKKGIDEPINGITVPATMSIIGADTQTVLCRPEKWDTFEAGRYKVIFEAEISGIRTVSTLRRLFIGDAIKNSESEKKRILGLTKISAIEPSKSADEFAALSFGVGAPYTNPFLDSKEFQPLIANIENKKDGIITRVIEAGILLPDGVRVEQLCTSVESYDENKIRAISSIISNINLSKTKKPDNKVQLIACQLTIPFNLRMPGNEWTQRDFESYMEYSYAITKEADISVS